MDRTRVAARISALATTVVAIAILYASWRATGADRARETTIAMLLSLPLPVGATLALFLPDRALGRAALVFGAFLPALSALSFIVVFWPRPGDDLLSTFRRGYANAALNLALFMATLAWAARPTRVPTTIVRALAAGAFALAIATPSLIRAPPAAFFTLQAVMGISVVLPLLALAIGLPRIDRAPTTL